QIRVDGSSLNYSAGVAVNDALQAGQRTFEILGSQSVQFSDNPTAGVEEARGQFGQDVQFAASSRQLRIDAAQQDPLADDDELDADVHGELIVEGDSADAVRIAGQVNLRSGDLKVAAGTIGIDGSVITDAATVELDATSLISISESAQIIDHGGQILADAGA